MQNLHTVYDFHNERLIPYFAWFPLLFVIIGLAVFLYNAFFADRESVNSWGINSRKFNMFFGLGFALFALSLSRMVIVSKLDAQNIAEYLFNSGKCKTIQGIVKDFHPMPAGGHDTEHFTVNGVYFEYYDNSPDPGYNTAQINGGIIKGNMYVKLTYLNYNDRNVIFTVETEKTEPTGSPN